MNTTKKLRLGPLPKTESVKLTFACPASLKTDLDRYAALHAQAYGEAIDADPEPTGRRHTVLLGAKVVFVDPHGLVVPRVLRRGLSLETCALIDRVVQLCKRVGQFHARSK